MLKIKSNVSCINVGCLKLEHLEENLIAANNYDVTSCIPASFSAMFAMLQCIRDHQAEGLHELGNWIHDLCIVSNDHEERETCVHSLNRRHGNCLHQLHRDIQIWCLTYLVLRHYKTDVLLFCVH